MKPVTLALAALILIGAVQAGAAQPERVAKLESAIAKAATGRAGEYARDLLDAAQASITASQAAARAGNARESQQKLELAELQVTAAEAKAAEKELVEQVAVKRAELKKLEAQLEKFRQGEEK